MMLSKLRASFDIVMTTDTLVLLRDRDEGATVTNDAHAVVEAVSERLGGIGRRRVYYRDTDGRFDELCVENEEFTLIRACSVGQQDAFAKLLNSADPIISCLGSTGSGRSPRKPAGFEC